MSRLYYCPACGQLYKAASAKYSSFCVRCEMATPRPATEPEKTRHEADRESLRTLAEKK